MNEKTSSNQTLLRKSHETNKHMGGPSCKILGTIFKIDKAGTQTNGSNDKKVMTMQKVLHLREDKDCMC